MAAMPLLACKLYFWVRIVRDDFLLVLFDFFIFVDGRQWIYLTVSSSASSLLNDTGVVRLHPYECKGGRHIVNSLLCAFDYFKDILIFVCPSIYLSIYI